MCDLSIDTETGGLYPSIHALLSIGAHCSWNGAQYLAYITEESQPERWVSPGAVAKNGYSRKKWAARGARPIQEVFPEFLAWIASQKKERPQAVLVCHNLAFDRSFLCEAERLTMTELPYRGEWRCSQVEFGRLMSLGLITGGSSSLDRLAELSAYPEARKAEHDALEDAVITSHGWQWLAHIAKSPEDTLRELYTASLKERRILEDALRCRVKAGALIAADLDRELRKKEGRADG